MPHIALPGDLPGIRGLMASKPSTGARLAQLAEELLRGASPLSPVERETIAVHVSRLNECEFCARSHAAAARHLDPAAPEPAARLDALLDVAGAVARGGRQVTPELVAAARAAGAGDEEIHDTVLIAAAFCMFNRYVDGLDAITPTEEAAYDAMGARLAAVGYLGSVPA